jgi:coenzyme F420-0:L-glutamate ligase / coenzyme F420-1:gamma-L-glutamate ligase
MENRGSRSASPFRPSSIIDAPSLGFHMSLSRKTIAFIRSARVAHLATADAEGQPHVIPICFVFNGNEFFSAIDEKPKQVALQRLKRLRNIQDNQKVSLVIDHYDEDWRKLVYVLITGKARLVFRGKKHVSAVRLLRSKYAQYRRMAIHERPMIAITPTQWKSWSAV